MSLRRFEDVAVGDELPERVVTLTRGNLVNYAGVSGDPNPIHWSGHVARLAGLPDVVAHGMLTMGMTGRAVTDRFGHANVLSFGGRIISQVWPGDTLTVRVEISAIRKSDDGGTVADLALTTRNQDGVAVFSGVAEVRVDSTECPRQDSNLSYADALGASLPATIDSLCW